MPHEIEIIIISKRRKSRRVIIRCKIVFSFAWSQTGEASSSIEGFVTGKHELFPIPIEEIQFSNGNWAQNPNY